MKQSSLTIILVLAVIALGALFLATRSSDNELPQAFVEKGGTVIIENHGGDMEGHTPRGFQGMGTGLFAGDNLNPNFPNGDGVQIFLTFDLSTVSAGSVSSAILRSGDAHIQGTPFNDLGTLKAEEVRYEQFSSALWDLEATGEACVFATNRDSSFSCDVREAVERSLLDGYPFAQFRLLFDQAGDSDNSQDMVMFFKRNSNTNEAGIFELEIVID